jgi:hypothetical protein
MTWECVGEDIRILLPAWHTDRRSRGRRESEARVQQEISAYSDTPSHTSLYTEAMSGEREMVHGDDKCCFETMLLVGPPGSWSHRTHSPPTLTTKGDRLAHNLNTPRIRDFATRAPIWDRK